MVRVSPVSSSKAARRSFRPEGRKPSKVNRRVSSPETASAATAAQQPGIACTVTPFSAHSVTSSCPGSLIAGVPASVTSAHVSPESKRVRIACPAAARLCSW